MPPELGYKDQVGGGEDGNVDEKVKRMTLMSSWWKLLFITVVMMEMVMMMMFPTLICRSHVTRENYFLSLNNFYCQGMSDTVWKVGCYRINPSTPSGQKFFILHMLVLPLIPWIWFFINLLIINQIINTKNNCIGNTEQCHHEYFVGISIQSFNHTKTGECWQIYPDFIWCQWFQVRGAMEIAVFIQNIQEERAEVALYIFTNQTNNVINNSISLNTNPYSRSVDPNRNRMGIQERFSQTDRALEEVPTWPNVSSILVRLRTN